MNRGRRICIAVLFAALMPACMGSSRISVPPATADPSTTPTTLAAPGTTATTATTAPAPAGFTFLQVARDDTDALIEITFPVLQGAAPSVSAKIIETVDNLVADFTDAASAAPAGDSRSTLTLEAAPELINADVFSVSGISFEFVRGGTPATRRIAWIFSVKTGSLIAPAELFVGGRLDALAAASREHLIANELGDAAALTVPDGLLPTPENFDAVWLTATGVGVGFDQFQVADGDAGSPAVLIPYAELLDAMDTTGILSPLQNAPTLPES